MRDAQQTGVAYGRYDLDWLISTATVGRREDGQLVVGFDRRKAPRVLEQLLVARRALYDTVYQHKTVRSAEGMIGLLLRRLRDVASDGPGWLSDQPYFEPYRDVLQGKALSPEALMALDDYSLWGLIMYVAARRDADETAADLARRIVARDLFKQVPVDSDSLTQFLVADDGRQRLYHAIASDCPGDSRYYVHVDRAFFDMFSDDRESEAYLVEQSRGSFVGRAAPARDHPELRALHVAAGETTRLFVPREALAAASRVLGV